MGLDLMQRPGVNINNINSKKQFHNIPLDKTEKTTLQLKN